MTWDRDISVGVVAVGLAALLLVGVALPVRERSAASPPVAESSDADAALVEARRLSRAFQRVASEVIPAVVNIRTRTREEPFDIGGLGSGMIVDAAGGFILTNYHVVEDADAIVVTLTDGREFQAEVVSSDEKTDLAVIRIEAEGLSEVRLGDSEAVEVGEIVLAIGSPLGWDRTVTHGIVSAIGRTTNTLEYEDFIQTDAAINPGNSGGPLVNLRGEVIGMNTAIATRTGAYNGIGFAIPVNRIRKLLPLLMRGEEIVRGYLGVIMSEVRQDRALAERLGWHEPWGILVTAVLPDSPAERSGLRALDILLEAEGRRIRSSGHLQDLVAASPPGTTVRFAALRAGTRITLPVRVGRQPEDFHTRMSGSQVPRIEPEDVALCAPWGMTLLRRAGDGEAGGEGGIVIAAVAPQSQAERLGLRPDDALVRIGGETTEDLDDLVSRLERLDPAQAVITVRRGEKTVTIGPSGGG